MWKMKIKSKSRIIIIPHFKLYAKRLQAVHDRWEDATYFLFFFVRLKSLEGYDYFEKDQA